MQSNIVVVPDMAAVDLTALVEKELNLTHLDDDFRQWDYYRGVDGSEILGRGRKYEALLWEPVLNFNETISSDAVRNHFWASGGFYGHVGAFTQWRRVCGLDGWRHATIPLRDKACCHPAGSYFDERSVPYSDFVCDRRILNMYWLDCVWSGFWSFVAFRELV